MVITIHLCNESCPRKQLHTADTLARILFISTSLPQEANSLTCDVKCFVSAVIATLPASANKQAEYKSAQAADSVCQHTIQFCCEGRLEQQPRSKQLHPYWGARHKFLIIDNLLLYCSCIVIPSSLQTETLMKIHTGLLGVQKWLLWSKSVCLVVRDDQSSETPGIWVLKVPRTHNSATRTTDINTFADSPLEGSGCRLVLKRCDIPFGSWLLFEIPWTGEADINKFTEYSQCSQGFVRRHGIPSQLRTDNGPQFASAEMESFSKAYGFEHTTSSPRYLQSNRQVEQTVRTVKNLLKKVDDMYMYHSLLVYLSTPLQWCNRSPTELCMWRMLRTNLPQVPSALIPNWTYLDLYGEADKLYKEILKRNFKHHVATLPEIPDCSSVLVQFGKTVIPPSD